MRTSFAITLISLIGFCAHAQQFSIYPEAGHSFNFPKRAGGYALGLNFMLNRSPKTAAGLEIAHIFNDSRHLLPKDFEQQRYLYQDDNFLYRNVASLPPKPNRYFNFNVVLKQLTTLFAQNGHSWQAGGGVVLSYRDEMEIKKVVEINDGTIRELTGSFNHLGSPYRVAVIAHDAYLDLGAMGEINYRGELRERLSLQASAKLFYYPPSGNWIGTSTLGVVFQL